MGVLNTSPPAGSPFGGGAASPPPPPPPAALGPSRFAAAADGSPARRGGGGAGGFASTPERRGRHAARSPTRGGRVPAPTTVESSGRKANGRVKAAESDAGSGVSGAGPCMSRYQKLRQLYARHYEL